MDCCEHRETAGAIGPPPSGFGFQEFLQLTSSTKQSPNSSVEFEVSRAMKDSNRWALVSFSAMSAESKAEGVSSLTFSGIGEFISVSTL